MHHYHGTSAVSDNTIMPRKSTNFSRYAVSLLLVLLGSVVSNDIAKPVDTYSFSSVVRNDRAVTELQGEINEADAILYDGYSPDDVKREPVEYNIMDVL